MKFKVGDRVKWEGCAERGEQEYLGTVTYINENNEYSINIEWDNGFTNFYSNSFLLELVQPELTKEPTMKFKVGDRVKFISDKIEYFGSVISVHSALSAPYGVKWDNGYTQFYSDRSAIYLVQPEVPLPEVAKEPVPGKFYRTQGGDKTLYVGKNSYGLSIYENSSGEYMHYRTPTQYYVSAINIDDIVGEWVDLPESQIEETKLPAMEIKRYFVVTSESTEDTPRGTVMGSNTKLRDAQRQVKSLSHRKLEIVELVGILPPSDVGKSTGTLPERKVK